MSDVTVSLYPQHVVLAEREDVKVFFRQGALDNETEKGLKEKKDSEKKKLQGAGAAEEDEGNYQRNGSVTLTH